MGLEMIDAGWLSILPPLIAITLALISKEVYSSLFLGVLSGMCVYSFSTGGNILQAVTYVFDMMALKIGENGYMIIFLVLLGSLVVVVTRSGGSDAYGQWAGKRIRKRTSAKLATALLGLLIFVDDGFNCLTVGTVMRPINAGFPGKSWPICWTPLPPRCVSLHRSPAGRLRWRLRWRRRAV